MKTLIHPGEVLADELTEIGISAAELARLIRSPGEPGVANHRREVGNHGGDGPATSAVFRHIGGILDESAKDL
jgi:hypothetical protein